MYPRRSLLPHLIGITCMAAASQSNPSTLILERCAPSRRPIRRLAAWLYKDGSLVMAAVWVENGQSPQWGISIISTANGQSRLIPVGQDTAIYPEALSSDGSMLFYVCREGANTFSLNTIRLSDGKVSRVTPIGVGTTYAYPTDDAVYVFGEDMRTIQRHSLIDENSSQFMVDFKATQIFASEDGKTLAVGGELNGSPRTAIVDVSTRSILRTASVSTEAISPNGKILYTSTGIESFRLGAFLWEEQRSIDTDIDAADDIFNAGFVFAADGQAVYGMTAEGRLTRIDLRPIATLVNQSGGSGEQPSSGDENTTVQESRQDSHHDARARWWLIFGGVTISLSSCLAVFIAIRRRGKQNTAKHISQ